jgi:preprotein translocase subunit YajC
MGAIIMSVLVSVIAIVGVIYFNHQDKKEQQKNEIKN